MPRFAPLPTSWKSIDGNVWSSDILDETFTPPAGAVILTPGWKVKESTPGPRKTYERVNA